MLFSPFERMVALRYLRPRRQEGFISVIAVLSFLGIALGVATLIIVMSVMNGFRIDLLTRVLGLNGHMNIYAARPGPLTDYEGMAERLRTTAGVVSVVPTVEGQALVTHGGAASGAAIRGVRPEDLRQRPVLSDHIVGGSLEDFAEDRIAIGVRMAQRLGVQVGDTLPLISPIGSPTAFGSIPRMRAYPIAAIFNVGMFEYDNTFIFMPLEAARGFYRMAPDAVSGLEVFVSNPEQIRSQRQSFLPALGGVARLVDWQQANSSFFNALQVERNVMFIILTLIIVVAALNIISSLIMLVKDKGRDIAILRTMGATRGAILRIFFLAGASIGVVGTIAGFGLGVAFTKNIETIRQIVQSIIGTDLFSAEIYFLTQIPAQMDPWEVVQVVAMGLILSFLATLPPAWRAARLDPVEALRYE